jgi:shikimate dehydrogenase
VAAVIGDPVRHSRSPAIHNAAFRACGLDWVYAAFEVPAGAGAAAVEAMRTLKLGGLSVTMPHKAAAAAAVDRLTGDAAALGVVNCVAWDGDHLVGDSTDGPGLVRALAAEPGWEPAGRRCAVVGAGGAARAVVLALARAGAAEVVVVNRTPERGEEAAALAGPVGRTGTAAELADAELVVQATPVGMGADAGSVPFDPALLHPGQVVVDLVYEPLDTALLRAARARGAVAVDGLGMLVHQAALQFERWTGVAAPVAAMTAAARAGTGGAGTG